LHSKDEQPEHEQNAAKQMRWTLSLFHAETPLCWKLILTLPQFSRASLLRRWRYSIECFEAQTPTPVNTDGTGADFR
jgi:hypothetical protein